MVENTKNSEFKGLAKEALRNINGDIKDIRVDIKELTDDFKDYCKKNDKDHKELFIAITEIKATKIPLKFWGGIVIALIGSFTSITVVVLSILF